MASGSQIPTIDNATAVWWDINSCPVPRDCSTRDVRPNVELALKNLCGAGPVTIFAMGDLGIIPPNEKEVLSYTQINLKHTDIDGIYADFHSWAKDHPPPFRMMLISGPGVSIHPLIRLFERKGYTFIRCYPCKNAPFLWENIMSSSLPVKLDETSTNQTAVWWDIDSCRVGKRRHPASIRGCIRTVLDKMSVGSDGPLSIYCMGNMRNISSNTKQAISSSGVSMIHLEFGIRKISHQLHLWTMDNPPPATMMLISNDEVTFHENLYEFEACGYKVIRSYPSPDKSSQDIRWKSIVEGKCREREKKEKEETGETCWYCETPWYCELCEFSSDDCISFSNHLDSKYHKDMVCASFPIR